MEICGTDEYHRALLEAKGRSYSLNRLNEEISILKYTLNFDTRIRGQPLMLPVVTIPVVVHVVYNKNLENISDEQIYSQISRLNKDYRRLNDAEIPVVWKPLAADSRIEFKLAGVDPKGNKTNGITRTATDVEFFDFDNDLKTPEKIKVTAEGGKDAWDSTRYLNIWVCNLVSGLSGYARFPRGEEATDGVVVSHWVFGEKGSVKSPDSPFGKIYNLGRTATHQIGHYLGLYHNWGVNGMISDTTAGDNVVDTPNQTGPNLGAPTFPSYEKACPDTGINGTMFMNYMDNTIDEVKCIFTNGQMVRMRAVLDNTRSSLLTSNVLVESRGQFRTSSTLPPNVYNAIDRVVPLKDLGLTRPSTVENVVDELSRLSDISDAQTRASIAMLFQYNEKLRGNMDIDENELMEIDMIRRLFMRNEDNIILSQVSRELLISTYDKRIDELYGVKKSLEQFREEDKRERSRILHIRYRIKQNDARTLSQLEEESKRLINSVEELSKKLFPSFIK